MAGSAKTRTVPRWGYWAYINSPEWAEVKRRYRASKLPQTCAICRSEKVDLHHRSYKRLGSERLTDLMPLCRAHHQAAHDLLKAAQAGGANPSRWNLWTAAKMLRKGRGRNYLTYGR